MISWRWVVPAASSSAVVSGRERVGHVFHGQVWSIRRVLGSPFQSVIILYLAVRMSARCWAFSWPKYCTVVDAKGEQDSVSRVFE